MLSRSRCVKGREKKANEYNIGSFGIRRVSIHSLRYLLSYHHRASSELRTHESQIILPHGSTLKELVVSCTNVMRSDWYGMLGELVRAIASCSCTVCLHQPMSREERSDQTYEEATEPLPLLLEPNIGNAGALVELPNGTGIEFTDSGRVMGKIERGAVV